jgi:hypothetical protein
MARLAHPNVVVVYEVVRQGEDVFVAMELVEGRTLRDWLADERRGWREIVRLFAAAGRGLAAAHAAGIIHRDFKPENVLIGDDGRVRVGDFGLAGSAGEGGGGSEGTPAYMSPEQHRRDTLDARSDQFAFCVALHEALHGKRPFAGDRPLSKGVPGWLDALVRRGLETDRELRHPSMEALVDELERDRRGPRRIAAVAAAMLLAAAAGLVATREEGGKQQCAGNVARKKIERFWGDPAKAGLARFFSAEEAAPVVATFDAYVEGWIGVHRRLCRAELEHRPDQLGYLCLRRRLAAFRTLVAVLLFDGESAGVRERAARAASALPAPASCDLDGPARAPRPSAPALEGRALLAETLLDVAVALERTGQLERAAALASAVTVEARSIGHPSLVALVEHARDEISRSASP